MLRFVLLAYGITWLAVSPLVLAAMGIGPGAPAWLHGLGAFGPVLAAYFLSPRDRSVYASLGPPSMSRRWIIACMATPVLFSAIALAVVAVQGAPTLQPLLEASRHPAWWLDLAVGSVLYGLGEEPGWRGWLLPRLQARHSAVRATLTLAPIWAVWHLPFFVYRFQLSGLGMVVGFFVGLLAGAFWLTFLFNSTGGSVVVVAAWHLLWNVANLSLAAVSDTAVGILNALMMVLGFGVLLIYGRRGLQCGRSGATACP